MFVLRASMPVIVGTITHRRLPDRFAHLVAHDEFSILVRSTSSLALSNSSFELDITTFVSTNLKSLKKDLLPSQVQHPCSTLATYLNTSELPPSISTVSYCHPLNPSSCILSYLEHSSSSL